MFKSKRFIEYTILIVLGIVWGSSFILMKKGLLSFKPIEIAAYRMFIAGLVLLPIFIHYFKKVPRHAFKYFFLAGLIGNALPAFMFVFAQTRLSSSVTGALNALTPLFTLSIGLFVYKIKLGINKTLGVVIGLIGAAMLILLAEGSKISGDIGYALLIVLAALFYGININIIKQKLSDRRPMVVAAFPIVFMALPCFFVLLFSGFFNRSFQSDQTLESLMFISILGVFGTALSLIAFNRLIQMSSAVFASSTTYIIPIIALFWGLLDHEKVNVWQLTGLALIITGIVLVNMRTRKKPENNPKP